MSKSNMLRVLVSLGLVGIPLTTTQAGAAPPVVPTTSGPVEGFTQDGLSVFLGIPYAAPHIDELPWRSPQPLTAWAPVVRSATTVGPQCPQFFFGILMGSEDCLYLMCNS